MYINELITYLLHKDDVHETIFEHYHHCLYSLEDEKNLEISLRQFEIKLLELLGFGLNLLSEADTGRAIAADAQYLYHLEHGAVVCTETTSRAATGTLPQISGSCLQALASESYQELSENSQYMTELKRLMRYVISFHLGNKKLKSRELFRPVAKNLPEADFS
jgi:DNA repair protein RecO (recombination protein O)